MQEIVLTVGISNSGKTTYVEEYCKKFPNYVNINRDDIRAKFCTTSGDIKDYKFSKTKETNVTEYQRYFAEQALEHGKSIFISDTNLSEKTRLMWKEFAEKFEVGFRFEDFPIEPHIAKKRNYKRDYTVPESVINRQYRAFREYQGLTPYTNNKQLPKAVIFDVDGTLADMKGVRNPFDWDKVHLDKVRVNVRNLLWLYWNSGYKIIILSGRDSCCKHLTEQWLKENSIPFDLLLQRQEGDNRCDAEIKEEIFWEFVAPFYNIEIVVDDRNQMVDRWRAMGLECFQVQEGDF